MLQFRCIPATRICDWHSRNGKLNKFQYLGGTLSNQILLKSEHWSRNKFFANSCMAVGLLERSRKFQHSDLGPCILAWLNRFACRPLNLSVSAQPLKRQHAHHNDLHTIPELLHASQLCHSRASAPFLLHCSGTSTNKTSNFLHAHYTLLALVSQSNTGVFLHSSLGWSIFARSVRILAHDPKEHACRAREAPISSEVLLTAKRSSFIWFTFL